jgi:uncharacterized protein (DUF58 family)
MIPALFTKEYFQQLETAKIRARKKFLGARQGGHISPRKGQGLEFSDYRQYELGDNPRNIDWNVYARSDRFVIKRFQEEEALSFLFMIDGSPSMMVDNKWSSAKEILLSLAYIALGQGDQVNSLLMGSSAPQSFVGKKSFAALASQLPETLKEQKTSENYFLSETLLGVNRHRYPGICFLISDFFVDFTKIESAFLALRKKNYETHIIQVVGAHDLNPAAVGESGFYVDSESGEKLTFAWSTEDELSYKKVFLAELERLEQFSKSSGMKFSRYFSSVNSVDSFILETVLPKGGVL